jgi:hypothetical protein
LSRALLATAVPLALAGGVTAANPTVVAPRMILAQNGFGNRENSYAWAMGWFKGKLYVGTGRDVLCVENETTQFYVPLTKKYSTTPVIGDRCPPDPYHMNLRAEIWQYTPGSGRWRRVYRSPATTRNPESPKKRVASDIGYRDMATYTDPRGRTALYAAGVSADEYLPPLLKRHPPRILRSYDGTHWHALHLPSVLVHRQGGTVRPMGFRSLVVWKHRLFVTATPDLTGDGSLFEIIKPWSDHPRLIQVTPPNLSVFEVVTFDGDLYLGCGNPTSGYSVWESSGVGRPFTPIVTGGAGRGDVITSVVSMKVYRNALYVGASGWYQNSLPLSEMIRIRRDGQWTLVVGSPRKLPDGKMAYPTSGLNDGFDSLFNAHFWRMAVQHGALYVGTNSWAYSLKEIKGQIGLDEQIKSQIGISDLLAGDQGYQLWATCDGEDFFPVTRDAFGTSENNFGARTLAPDGPNGENLYIGSANHPQGTTIIDDREPACSSLINRRHVVASPSAMIADTVHRGTLLSWKPSASAARYEVLAAREISATVYLQGPPTMPNGFQLEGAVPTLASPEAPGSVPVTVSLPGAFEPVATTSSSHYLARLPGHRVYEVLAMNARGKTSGPSNAQIAPAPEPPPTFSALRPLLGGWPLASAARGGARSRPERLLGAAQAAWSRGNRSTALRDVQRLQAAARGQDEQVSALALRLERRLKYANVAGGP